MAGESTRTNSVNSCTYVLNGLYLYPYATKFDSLRVTDSLSYFSVPNIAETQPFISDISYIDTYPVQPSIKQEKPKLTQHHSPETSPMRNRWMNQPTWLCHLEEVEKNDKTPKPKSDDTKIVTINLSTKKKYKPVTLKVRPHIGTLLEILNHPTNNRGSAQRLTNFINQASVI